VLGTLAFDNESRNQLYFLRVTPLLLAVAGAWGLAILARRPPRRTATLAAGSFFVTGFVFALVLERLTPSSLTAGRTHAPSELVVLSQTLLLLAAVALVAVTITILARSRPSLRGVAPLVCATLVLGMGTAASTEPALRLLVTPREENHVARDIGAKPTIGVGGITAARWLRDHSDPDAIVATNSHCRIPDRRPCDHRTTWVAAFTERQILIEGWSYTSVTNAEGKKQGHTTPYLDYWKPRVLAANDRVFRRPTQAAVTRLHQRYGVDWLFADEREGADLAGLEKVADLRYRKGDYAVYRID
jgi:hypothetical protein